ncbi:helix-turn-helix domain-containing protein [Mycolicibacterium lutetiense]
MGIFEELAEEFGLGQDTPEAQLAADLAAADEEFMSQLVQLRRAAGLTQENLGKAWGRHKTAVSQFERPGADPRLSTIRRYAASIGARYVHFVSLDPRMHRHLKWADPIEVFHEWTSFEIDAVETGELTGPCRIEFAWPRNETDHPVGCRAIEWDGSDERV